MSETSLVPQPFLDWFGVWPGQAGPRRKRAAPGSRIRRRASPSRCSRRACPRCSCGPGSPMGAEHPEPHDGAARRWPACACGTTSALRWRNPAASTATPRVPTASTGTSPSWASTSTRARPPTISSRITGPSTSTPSSATRPRRRKARYKAIESRGQLYRRGRPVPNQRQTKLEIREVRRAMELNGYTPEQIDAEADIRHLLRGAVSPDGLRWTVLEEPRLRRGSHPARHPEHRRLRRGHPASTWPICAATWYGGARCGAREVPSSATGIPPGWCSPSMPTTPPTRTSTPPATAAVRAAGATSCFPTIYHRLSSTLDIHLASSRDGWLWHRHGRRPVIGRHVHGEEYGALYASPNLVPVGDEWGLPVPVLLPAPRRRGRLPVLRRKTLERVPLGLVAAGPAGGAGGLHRRSLSPP